MRLLVNEIEGNFLKTIEALREYETVSPGLE